MKRLFISFSLLLLTILPAVAQEPYAVLSDDNTVLTFYYDENKESRGGYEVGPFYYNNNSIRWGGHSEDITTVVFDASFAKCTTLTSTAHWFNGCKKLTTINGIEHLCTGNVTNMRSMFASCSSLTNLDVSHFDTGNVTDMCNMFGYCYSLSSLDLIFETGCVKDMSYMFYDCTSLTNLNVSGLNTRNVTDMECMFSGCSNLTNLDVSHFDTSNVTNMTAMFSGCSNLTSLDVSNFNTSNVTSMNSMFGGCTALTTLDVSHFDTSNVIYMGGMFYECHSLMSLDVRNFDTRNVTDMNSMFGGCTALTTLDVSHFDTSNVTSMLGMFSICSGLTSLDISMFDTRNVTNMLSMFSGCESLTNLDISNLETKNVTSMNGMFYECHSLMSLDVRNFDTRNVTDMARMFKNCCNLKTIYCDDTWIVENSDDMFSACNSLKGYSHDNANDATFAKPIADGGYFTPSSEIGKDIGEKIVFSEPYAVYNDDTVTFFYDHQKPARKGVDVDLDYLYIIEYQARTTITKVVFDPSFANCTTITRTDWWFKECEKLTTIEGLCNLKTDNVTSMEGMFFYCSSLESLDLRRLNTEKVTTMSQMFCGCTNLKSIDVSGFNTANVTDMSIMFSTCSSLEHIDVSNFNTTNVTNMYAMFSSCTKLTSLDVSNFDTRNVTTMNSMFFNCPNLTTIYCNDDWNAEGLSSGEMFTGCTSLPGYSYYKNYAIFAKPIADGGYFTPISEKIKPIGEETTINPSDEAVPGKTVITKDGLVISLGENDTVDKENGNVTVTTIMSPDELKELLKQTKPNEPRFYGQFKSMYSMLAAGSGIMEITFQTLGDYDFIVMQGTDKVARYKQDEKGTIRVKYDSNENEWVFFFPTVSAAARAKMGREAIEGGLVIYSIKIIPGGAIPGDANNDGVVNAADIVEVVSYIMGTPSGVFNETAADANGDGTVNAADIVAIVNIIMGN